MDSIINQLKGSFEIVVCDNCSNDGSREILQEYARRGKIKLVVEQSSRGKGRQIAFENSTGKYIVSGIDTDDTLNPAFQDFLDVYHRDHEGYMLSANTICIIPRTLVEEIEGWRDLKYFEDIDFRRRAESIGRWHELEYRLVLVERGKNKRSFISRMIERYNAAQCAYRIGKSVLDEVKTSVWFYKPILLVVALDAAVVCKLEHVQKFRYSDTECGRERLSSEPLVNKQTRKIRRDNP